MACWCPLTLLSDLLSRQLVAPLPPHLPRVLHWVRTEGRDGNSCQPRWHGKNMSCFPLFQEVTSFKLKLWLPPKALQIGKLCFYISLRKVVYSPAPHRRCATLVCVLLLGQVPLKAKPFSLQGSCAGVLGVLRAGKLSSKWQQCVSVGAASSNEHCTLWEHRKNMPL